MKLEERTPRQLFEKASERINAALGKNEFLKDPGTPVHGMIPCRITANGRELEQVWLPHSLEKWKKYEGLPFPGGDGAVYKDYGCAAPYSIEGCNVDPLDGNTVVLLQDWGLFTTYRDNEQPAGYKRTKTALVRLLDAYGCNRNRGESLFLTNYWLNLRDSTTKTNGQPSRQSDPFTWNESAEYSKLCFDFLVETLCVTKAANLLIVGHSVYDEILRNLVMKQLPRTNESGMKVLEKMRAKVSECNDVSGAVLSRLIVIHRRRYRMALTARSVPDYIEAQVT